jgi:hypothetical protein
VTWRPPGSSSSPVPQRSVIYKRGLQALGQLTSFNRLLDSLTDSTLRRHICLLCLESSTCIAVAALIHSFLQRAFFPPEDIVAVLAVAGSSHSSALHRNVWTNQAYLSPMEYTKGWEPSSGQMLLSLKSVVSHMTSYINCGILSGCDAGQGPPDSKDPLAGYATWSLWLGLSRSLPFQHLFTFSISSHAPAQVSD